MSDQIKVCYHKFNEDVGDYCLHGCGLSITTHTILTLANERDKHQARIEELESERDYLQSNVRAMKAVVSDYDRMKEQLSRAEELLNNILSYDWYCTTRSGDDCFEKVSKYFKQKENKNERAD